jgi:hypothetical protein
MEDENLVKISEAGEDYNSHFLKQQLGLKSASYYFYYHEDYPSDVINEYIWLQEKSIDP